VAQVGKYITGIKADLKPSPAKKIKRMWYIHTMKYYLPIIFLKTDMCYNMDEH
jgi:hypothetical protein